MAKEILMTREGYHQLESRLEYLKITKRAEVAERIKIARDFGDLSENAEYDAAKDEQGMVESEILSIEEKLSRAKIVEADEIQKDVAGIGSNVKVLDKEFSEELVYKLVGTTEVNIRENKISTESPLGKALMGHKAGDTVTVVTPQGKVEYEILEIQ